MSTLNAKGRKRVARRNYAVPKGTGSKPSANQYPIHDASHARNALARVAQHGTPAEKRRVRSAVARRYPSLGKRRSVVASRRKRA